MRISVENSIAVAPAFGQKVLKIRDAPSKKHPAAELSPKRYSKHCETPRRYTKRNLLKFSLQSPLLLEKGAQKSIFLSKNAQSISLSFRA